MKLYKKSLLLLSCLTVMFFMINAPLHGQAKTNSPDGSVAECYKNPSKCNDQKNNEQTTTQVETKQTDKIDIGFGDVIKMVAALVFVIVLLYMLLKFINRKSQSYQQNKLIQNFGGTSLGGNRSVQIVKVGNRLLILGVGEDIRLLQEINDPEEIADYHRLYNDQLDQALQPTNLIRKWLKKNKSNANSNNSKTIESFPNLLKKSLEDISQVRKDAMIKFEEESKQDE